MSNLSSQRLPFTRCEVIIPVYNAFDESLRCLRSVLALTPGASRILVIDDASPAGEFREAVDRAGLRDPRLSILRNARNRGFVGTCNLGMDLAGTSDVILLNSDTEVTAGWLEKLQGAAYSRKEVGTVTALSNNGSICSTPRFAGRDELPPGFSLAEFGRLVELVSDREYVELPTCVGHCVYLKRALLDRVAGFDEQSFGKGYGEENDLSCRGQLHGFVDIVDDSTFIYHKGNSSFGAMREQLATRNLAVLNDRHPGYDARVQAFWRSARISPVHARIWDELVRRAYQGAATRVLHVLHNGPHVPRCHGLGGTELHVRSLVQEGGGMEQWSLVPHGGRYVFTAHIPAGDREYHIPLSERELPDVLALFPVIHVHHTMGFDTALLGNALRQHGNYFVSVHDYFGMCPRVNLLTPQWTHCNGHECVSSCGVDAEEIRSRREETAQLLAAAQSVICFSNSTALYLRHLLGRDFPKTTRMRHGILLPGAARSRLPAPPRPSAELPLRVAFVGGTSEHKGALIVKALSEQVALPSGTPVEWHIIGEYHIGGEGVPPGLRVHGRYEVGELRAVLADVAPHLIIVASVCPETYCLTLDEGWSVGIPALVTPLGAPAERVKENGAGWVLRDLNPLTILNQLDALVSDWDSYLACRARVAGVAIRSIRSEAEELFRLYRRASAGRRWCPVETLVGRLGGLLKVAARSELSVPASEYWYQRNKNPTAPAVVPG